MSSCQHIFSLNPACSSCVPLTGLVCCCPHGSSRPGARSGPDLDATANSKPKCCDVGPCFRRDCVKNADGWLLAVSGSFD